jgi:hypothetical protein
MASIIKIKRSTSPGSAPSSLSAGEIAVNIPDRLLFVGDGTSIYRIGAQYLAVANASAIYATKAYAAANSYVNTLLANTNASIATQATRITLVNTNLTGTNTALRTLISDRLQVANAAAIYQTIATERAALANTNASIATQAGRITLVNTNLTGTNTALRTLIADRLQLANAAAIYQTIATERAALANTNSSIATQAGRITLVNTNLTGTNTALRTLISDRLQVANAATIYATKINPTTSGILAHTGRATISTNLEVSGNTSIAGLKANNALGTAGQILKSNGTTVYWDSIGAQTQYLQVANANATFVTKVNPTTSGVFDHTGRMTISTNLAVSGNTRISGSTIIDGDLTVEGGVTYISSSTLNVDDSMIKLSSNNAADTVDTGFYGKYVAAATTKYAGIFRDASDGVFKVFSETEAEPGTTVNLAGTGYALAQLDAIIDGGTY